MIEISRKKLHNFGKNCTISQYLLSALIIEARKLKLSFRLKNQKINFIVQFFNNVTSETLIYILKRRLLVDNVSIIFISNERLYKVKEIL